MATATKERPERIASNVSSRGASSPGAKTGASGDDSAGKRKGKSMKVKLAALLVLLLAGGAVAKFTVLASPAKPAGKAAAPAKGPVVPMEEMTLNLADGHYLRMKIALQTAKGTSTELDTSEAAQALIDTYSNQTVAQLTGNVGRTKAKEAFLGKLATLYPKKIIDAYYTEFVMTT
jgi:flagellar FliL protein